MEQALSLVQGDFDKSKTGVVTFEKIEQEAKELESVVYRTPTIQSQWLSQFIDGEVFLKLENLQITGSFKSRGTYVCMKNLTDAEKSRGVITMSSGNHAHSVAYHAQKMGIAATIVMPESTPIAKVERTRSYGASIILHGETILDARDFTLQLMRRNNHALIHPFDDANVIIGQGSVGIEMLTDIPNLDVLLIPIGGGALASGVGIVAKKLNPAIQIIGIQSLYSPSTAEILFPNTIHIDARKDSQTIAEGIAVKAPGHLTLEILRDVLDDMLIVNEPMIENAMEALIVNNKIIAEGAGAAGVAAILASREIFKGKRVGTIICGGNVDSRILSNLLMRGLVQEGRLVRLKIEVTDNPGILGQLSQIIGKIGGNIFEISHQRFFNNIMIKTAYVCAVVETRDANHANMICKALIESGYPTKIVEDSL
ncbi:MAG: threonine ammonia-lyase [Candidatus Paracaedibacteraceae bacterium]|nr:threonine ammonia-lyase [Candidatus Paracaedibacteraceae bacterium]